MATPAQKITRSQWDATHADYKSVGDDGVFRVLKLDPKLGTVSVPVEIED